VVEMWCSGGCGGEGGVKGRRRGSGEGGKERRVECRDGMDEDGGEGIGGGRGDVLPNNDNISKVVTN